MYREFAQHDPHIACLLNHDPNRSQRQRRILPDACVDIVWGGTRLVVAGPATGPKLATISPELRRRSACGSAWARRARRWGSRPRSCSMRRCRSRTSGPTAREMTERIGERPSVAMLAELVRARLTRAPDALARAAATGADPNLSERHLRRRFADAVGYGPKTLQRILRFQRFLALAQPRTDLARLAFEAGYADQAHLTRECTRLAGLPPAALLASGAGPAGETSVSFKTTGPSPPAGGMTLSISPRRRTSCGRTRACSTVCASPLLGDARRAGRAALRAYRNADGGFGHALEPDLRGTVSQPGGDPTALEVLDEAGVLDDPT